MRGKPFGICYVCGDRVGVYEPATVLEVYGERETSIAREPRLLEGSHTIMAHAACAAGLMGRRPAPGHGGG